MSPSQSAALQLLRKWHVGLRRVAVAAGAIAAVIILSGAIAAGVYSLSKGRQIARFQSGFAEVALGDTSERVVAIMGPPHQVCTGDEQWLFPDAPHDPEHAYVEGAVSVVQYCYRVETFFLPVTWAFNFDEGGKLVSKMRLD
jgi:hypothetical protein